MTCMHAQLQQLIDIHFPPLMLSVPHRILIQKCDLKWFGHLVYHAMLRRSLVFQGMAML